MIPFYLITNVGTLTSSTYAQHFPRHFLLAQIYTNAPPVYQKIVRDLRRRGLKLILDCGAYEGVLIDIPEYVDIIKDIKPDIVVLPDIPFDGSATKERAKEFLMMTQWQAPHYIYVPHGDCVSDTLAAYDIAFHTIDPLRFIIGLGISYKHWCSSPPNHGCDSGDEYDHPEKGRIEFVQDVLNITGAEHFRLHLFGGRRRPTKQFTRWTDQIVGLDAYDPCACALSGRAYPIEGTFKKLDHGSLKEPATDDLLKTSVENFCELYGINAGRE